MSKEQQPIVDSRAGAQPHEKTRQQNFVLVIHGGAPSGLTKDEFPLERRGRYRAGLVRALEAGYQVLQSGGEAMDAAVAAVTVMEDCPLFNAGKGSVFNVAGKNELEASLMVSKPPATHPTLPPTRRGISVTLLTRTKNPSDLVRALYVSPDFAPHPMLSGDTVETIGATHLGMETVDPSYFWTETRWREHRAGLGLPVEPIEPPSLVSHTTASESESESGTRATEVGWTDEESLFGEMPKGTVGAVALDVRGCLATVTSTGGRTNKLVGRIGDTPIMGSGFWAEEWQRQGSLFTRTWDRLLGKPEHCGVGISCTGDGDFFIRRNTASAITHRMKYLDESLDKAARHVVNDLYEDGGIGGIIALDKQGNAVLSLNGNLMYRGVVYPDGVPLTAIFSDDKLSKL